MPYCPECGSEIAPTARFCMKCGYNLKAEETQLDKNKPALNDAQVKSAGVGVDVGLLALGLICGIITLIGATLPWVVCNMQYCLGSLIPGWNAAEIGDFLGRSYPYPYFVFAGSAMMIVSALWAILAASSTRRKLIQKISVWLAVIGSLLALIASLAAIYCIAIDIDVENVSYGLNMSSIFSLIGFVGFATAAARLSIKMNPHKHSEPAK